MPDIPEIAKSLNLRVAKKLAGYLGWAPFDALPIDKAQKREWNRTNTPPFDYSQDEVMEIAEAVVAEAPQGIQEKVR